MSTMGDAGRLRAAGRFDRTVRGSARAFALAACAWIALLCATATADVSGTAVIIDGDTIDVGGERIRLQGIDAPESRQHCSVGGSDWSCGESATLALEHEARGRTVNCKGSERDRYGRVLAVCFAGNTDLNAMMVREGFALAYRRYSREYVAEEEAARVARKGLWRSSFVEPWKWRRSGAQRARNDRQ